MSAPIRNVLAASFWPLTYPRTSGVTVPAALQFVSAHADARVILVGREADIGTALAKAQGGAAADAAAVITEAHVAELTPNVAEEAFFEAAEAFFSGDLRWPLPALHRHFFTGGDARPVLAALQNRNRILLQVRALVDAGEARVGPRGLDGLQRAAATYGTHFTGATEKSSFNIFTQNAWYVGKLAGGAPLPSLRRLIDNQREFVAAFEGIVRRHDEQEEVLREMAVRCLAPA